MWQRPVIHLLRWQIQGLNGASWLARLGTISKLKVQYGDLLPASINKVDVVEKDACGGVNENVPHRFVYLNIWCLDGETFLGRVKRSSLLGGGITKDRFWGFQSCCHYQNVFPSSFPPTPPPFSLCLMPVDQYVISIYATMSLLYHRGLRASGTLSTIKCFLLCIVLVTVFCYSNRNIIKTEVGIEEWATSEANLTRLFFGEMWKNLVFWTRLETVNGA